METTMKSAAHFMTTAQVSGMKFCGAGKGYGKMFMRLTINE